ncbi:PA2169 family four-helix-bundle protein [uncultured Tateyamaria sp.]|uniref:ferritin-like domain-containing protein n=1 Tax=uncultured Tateyamaria sp. TaxID=455651 RepID=UPI00262A46B3|nr:PA2169 family four-helix-bundle protein [uncultured Tateyamaria sp.]
MKTETDALKDLYTTLIDSREGYAEAAEAVDSNHLQSMFTDLSNRRAQDAVELRSFLAGTGVEIDDDGSLLGTAHRSFVDLKERVMGDDASVVEEVLRGEQHLLDAYDRAIEPMTANSEAYNFATKHYRALSDRLDALKAEKRKAA